MKTNDVNSVSLGQHGFDEVFDLEVSNSYDKWQQENEQVKQFTRRNDEIKPANQIIKEMWQLNQNNFEKGKF